MKRIYARYEGNTKFLFFYFFLFLVLFLSLPSALKAQITIGHTQKGKASFYARKFHGQRTSSGERYHNRKMTAAHRRLPFGTLVKVTNLRNGTSVVVRINDRGPFCRGRLIDVSQEAAHELGMVAAGTAPVEIEVIGTDAVSPQLDTQTLAQISDPLPPKNITFVSTASKPQLRSLPEPVVTNHHLYHPGKVYTLTGVAADTRGFGVQVGAFQQLDNAMTFCKDLTDKQIRHVYIKVEKLQENKTFCVVTGTFTKRKEAEAYIVSLREKGLPNGFVKKYTN